jgi:hypothetical protein
MLQAEFHEETDSQHALHQQRYDGLNIVIFSVLVWYQVSGVRQNGKTSISYYYN